MKVIFCLYTVQSVLWNGKDLKSSSQWNSLWQNLKHLVTLVVNIALVYMTTTAVFHKSSAVSKIDNKCSDPVVIATHWGLLSSSSLWQLPGNWSSNFCCLSYGKWLFLSVSWFFSLQAATESVTGAEKAVSIIIVLELRSSDCQIIKAAATKEIKSFFPKEESLSSLAELRIKSPCFSTNEKTCLVNNRGFSWKAGSIFF